MSGLFRGVTLIAATVSTGLMAGLFYAFAYSVMPGLGGTDDRTFIDSMQRINKAILNGWFMMIFAGALIFTVLAGILFIGEGWRRVLPWIGAALFLYILTLVITVGVNVPLNDKLADAGDPNSIRDLAAVRNHFESTWVIWNIARAVTCTAAFACLTWALVVYGQVTKTNT